MKNSQAIEVDENVLACLQRDLERKRKRAQAARARKPRMEARKPGKLKEADQIRFRSKLKATSNFYISN